MLSDIFYWIKNANTIILPDIKIAHLYGNDNL